MQKFRGFVAWLLIHTLVFHSVALRAESIDDKLTNISPNHSLGSGEYKHGEGYGKILIRVLMFGAVNQQGVHYVPEGTDLLFALLYTGGYNNDAKMNGITIRRKGVKELIQIDLEDLLADAGAVPKLYDGDVVHVPHSWRKDLETLTTVSTFITGVATLATMVATLMTLQRTQNQSLPTP